jgi:class 3 adenylate cyclase
MRQDRLMMTERDANAAAGLDPALARVVAAWSNAGHWATAVDDRWRSAFFSEELRAFLGNDLPLGEFAFGSVYVEAQLSGRAGLNSVEEIQAHLRHLGGWVLMDLPGGRDALREKVDPRLRDIVDGLEPRDDDAVAFEIKTESFGHRVGAMVVAQRVRDASGRLVRTVTILKPSAGMNTLGMLASAGNLGHFERMMRLMEATRRPTAVMFADLEGSTALAKRMPTANYLALVRRITSAADRCVVKAGGIVGRHAGDGFTAFFVAATLASESEAALACANAARELQAAMPNIATRHDLAADALSVRAGLHWGATLYVGGILTDGRTEVTALGDEVNEAARIEACATGGRVLASKDLIERLEPADAEALGIDPDQITYTQLADLDTATEKARRDAPAIPVYDIASPTT